MRMFRSISRPAASKPQRSGSLITEMVVCTVLLGAVTCVMIPVLSRLIEQRKMIRYDALCVVELDNTAQQIRQLATAQQTFDQVTLTDSFLRRYPQAKLTVEPLSSEPASGNDPESAITSLQALRIKISRPGLVATPEIVRTVVVWIPAPASSSGAASGSETASEVQP